MPSPESGNWKREPLVWLLIAIPATAIVMGLIMLALAIQSWSGLVVDDYYQKGKQINRVLARDKRAWELGLQADLSLANDGVIILRFDPTGPVPHGEDIELSLVHATRPGLDRRELVHRLHDHLLAASTPPTGEGRWNVYLQTSEWRLTGSWHYPGTNRVTLRPNYPPE
jgi:hypothetical protein